MADKHIDRTIKVGKLGLRAIDDIKPKAAAEIQKALGFQKKITDKDAIEILGYKYLKKNFGTVRGVELAGVLNIKNNKKGRRW
jgi:hypothetical protein